MVSGKSGFFKIFGIAVLALVQTICFGHSSIQAQTVQPTQDLERINVAEHLGQRIPLDLVFTNDAGQQVQLNEYFKHGNPVILVMAYYTCPMLCTLVMNGLAEGIKKLDWIPGKQFQVLTVSINPLETSGQAAVKRADLLKAVGKTGIDGGWRFFVGQDSAIHALANAVGFQYYYDQKQQMYAHPTVIMILTEDGKISRYLYGISFNRQDLRLGLLEASDGKIGNTIDRIVLYCYHYDPKAQGYVLFAMNVMKLGGAATVLIMALFLGTFWARERARSQSRVSGNHPKTGEG
jgi:protein SCO1/2